jgi:hypothetical protein
MRVKIKSNLSQVDAFLCLFPLISSPLFIIFLCTLKVIYPKRSHLNLFASQIFPNLFSLLFIPSRFYPRSKNNKISITSTEKPKTFLFLIDLERCCFMHEKQNRYVLKERVGDIIFNMIFVMWSRRGNEKESTNQPSCNATMIYFGHSDRKSRNLFGFRGLDLQELR